ncbi:TRAP-type C4-dicarboxylate transport system permease small subunit [Rhodobium orientis]|nr:TRAP transporter small permease [Rhodobium orientis]MBB4301376.1 TRAP-type C4-dicarboxylate transport system permease small subunit [Rhodobium orientis]
MLHRFERILARLEDALAGVLLAAVLFVITYEMVLRGLFGHSNLWTDELSRVLLVTMVYIGVIGVTRDGGNIKVELIVSALGEKTQKVLVKIVDVLCLVFSLAATWLGIEYVIESIGFGISFAHSNLPFPVWVSQLIVPIAFGMISIRLVLRIAGIGPSEPAPSVEV